MPEPKRRRSRFAPAAVLTAVLFVSAGAHAEIITFDGLPTGNVSLGTYHGFSFSKGIFAQTYQSSDAHYGGTQALGYDAFQIGETSSISSATPFVLSRINAAPMLQDEWWLGAARGLQLTGFLNGQVVATSSLSFVRDPDSNSRAYFSWYDLGNAFDRPIDTLSIWIDGIGGINDAWYFSALDVAPVPEPETWALLGLGVVSVLARQRRRRATVHRA
ncbi:PEP-CTERM sorting domain-containing protein [Amantichitinum ursilacus]|nr:PEP-CTERM sorting domain-containing protein [Amantichitinum ursilacus]